MKKCATSLVVLDLDETTIFNRKRSSLSITDLSELKKNGSVYATGKYTKYLVLMKNKLNTFFNIAIKNNIPVVIMTHGKYPHDIVPAIIHADEGQDKYTLHHISYSYDITENSGIKDNHYHRYVIQMKANLKDTTKTNIFFFNRHDIGASIEPEYKNKRTLFKAIQTKLQKIRGDEGHCLNKAKIDTLSWKKSTNGKHGEERKSVSILATLPLITNECPEYKKSLNIMEGKLDLNSIVLVDDHTLQMRWARAVGIGKIQANLINKDPIKSTQSKNYKYYINKKNIRKNHFDRLIQHLESASAHQCKHERAPLSYNKKSYGPLFLKQPTVATEIKKEAGCGVKRDNSTAYVN